MSSPQVIKDSIELVTDWTTFMTQQQPLQIYDLTTMQIVTSDCDSEFDDAYEWGSGCDSESDSDCCHKSNRNGSSYANKKVKTEHVTSQSDQESEDIVCNRDGDGLSDRSRISHSDDGYDELSEQIEETIFSLQEQYFFLHRIHCHDHVGVYKAVHKESKKLCCIKIVIRHGISRVIERDPIEVKILQHIQNRLSNSKHLQNFQNLREYMHNTDVFVIVSDYIPSVSFRTSVSPYPEKIWTVITQLIGALGELHTLRVIYRDIKPSNLLFDESSNNLTLIDFDLSTFDGNGHTAVLGTDGFFAPEILKHCPDSDSYDENAKAYDNKVDIYAAGMVLGCMIFGVSEVDVETGTIDTWRSTKVSDVRYTGLYSLFKWMTEEDPEKRPPANHIIDCNYICK